MRRLISTPTMFVGLVICVGFFTGMSVASGVADPTMPGTKKVLSKLAPPVYIKRYMSQQVVHSNRSIQHMVGAGKRAGWVGSYIELRRGKLEQIARAWRQQIERLSEETNNRLVKARDRAHLLVALPPSKAAQKRVIFRGKRSAKIADEAAQRVMKVMWSASPKYKRRSTVPTLHLRESVRQLVADAEGQMWVHEQTLGKDVHKEIDHIYKVSKAALDVKVARYKKVLEDTMKRVRRAHNLSLRIAREAVRRRRGK